MVRYWSLTLIGAMHCVTMPNSARFFLFQGPFMKEVKLVSYETFRETNQTLQQMKTEMNRAINHRDQSFSSQEGDKEGIEERLEVLIECPQTFFPL